MHLAIIMLFANAYIVRNSINVWQILNMCMAVTLEFLCKKNKHLNTLIEWDKATEEGVNWHRFTTHLVDLSEWWETSRRLYRF